MVPTDEADEFYQVMKKLVFIVIQYVIVFTYLSSFISLVLTENLVCENIEFF